MQRNLTTASRIGLMLLVSGSASLGVFAQEATPPKPPNTTAEKPAATPETGPANVAGPADFGTLFAEWKALLEQLKKIQLDYKSAKPEDRQALKDQFQQLVTKGETLEPQLKKAAEAAYTAKPDNQGELAEFIAAMASDAMRKGEYGDALRRARLLIDNGYENKRIYDVGGTAAFYADEPQTAVEYLRIAADSGLASEQNALMVKEAGIRAAEAKADDLPRVLLKTNKGDITVELFENEAPQTVGNFVNLVEKGFYQGLTFHRVLEDFMAQAGDPKGDGTGGPGYRIPCECYQDNHRKHFAGSLSMAKTPARDTGGSQFYLTFVATPHLDGKHTVFGRIIEGMDVLPKLQRRDPTQANPPEPDKIIEATVLRKRGHDYKPTMLPE